MDILRNINYKEREQDEQDDSDSGKKGREKV